ncbi:hypothetical protein FRC01_004185 [Tulasnella sp. 417]|nr:hypothetical protein FRC01_004185 [Tulasnella sp. 417]
MPRNNLKAILNVLGTLSSSSDVSWVVKSGLLNGVETDHRKISKIVGRIWNNLRQDEKAKFEQDAREEKDRHYQLHPDYRYAPSYRKDGSSSTKSSKAGSPSSSRRRVKGPMNSREEKRVKLIAKLVTGGAGRDGVRQRVKDFDRGVLDLCDDGDSEMCSEYRDGDEDSDFEDGLSKKKAKRAHARRAAKKKTIALPSLPPPLPVTEHDLPTSDHPVMPSAHSMATRRRSLSTPSLPTVPAIASSVRRPKAHARTYSDIAAAPRSGIRISKGRTTNNSLSASTAFAHVPMDGESSDDEYSFDYGTHSGREQKRKGEKKAKMQKESSAHVETRPTTPFTLSHPPTPLTFLGSTTPISSQSTPLSATPSLGYRTPSPDPGTSAFNSPSIGVGWSLNSDFLNPPSSSSEARGSGSQLLEEDLRMYDTLGLDEGPSSLLDEFGLGVFGELSGLNSTGEVYDASYLLQDHYLISGHEAGPMEGVKVPTTRNSLSEAISRFRFPPEAVGTPESASIFDPAYPLSAPMNTTILVSSPALNPVEPSPAPEFDYWLNEDYFLSPSRGDETLDGGEQEDDLEAYRRGMDAARSAALETF